MNERQTLGLQHFHHRRRVEYPVRLQDEYVFVYSLSGRISVTEASDTRILNDGELLIGNSLRWRASEDAAHGPCEGLTLIVSPKLIPGFPVFEGKREARHPRRIVEEALDELGQNRSGKQELLEALSRELLVRALRRLSTGQTPLTVYNNLLISQAEATLQLAGSVKASPGNGPTNSRNPSGMALPKLSPTVGASMA